MKLRETYNKRDARAGFTLTEVAIVLGVIGVITSGIFIAAATARKHIYLNQATDELNQIVSNTRSFFAGQSTAAAGAVSFATATPLFIQRGVFPPEMLVPQPLADTTPCVGTIANNPWNAIGGGCVAAGGGLGSVQLQLVAPAGGLPEQMVVRYTGVPSEYCMDLVINTSATSNETGLSSITITALLPLTYSALAYTLPVSASNASKACGGAKTVTVDWSYNAGE